MTPELDFTGICNAISICIGDYPTLYADPTPNPAAVLDQWFFTIGNGYEWDEEDSYLNAFDDLPPIHLTPDFDPEVRKAEKKEDWMRHAKWKAGLCSIEKDPEPDYEAELNSHVYPSISSTMLDKKAFMAQIKSMEQSSHRLIFSGNPNMNLVVRPYPLCQYSKIYSIDEKTPKEYVVILHALCEAWVEYLKNDILMGRYCDDEGKHSYNGSATLKQTQDTIDKLSERVEYLETILPV
jgi:hypothetical protein